MPSMPTLTTLIVAAAGHDHEREEAGTLDYIVIGGGLIAALVAALAAVFIARALVKRSARSRPACGECGHSLDPEEDTCPFCGARRPGGSGESASA